MANIILAVFIAFTAGATCLDLKNIKGRLLTPEEGCGISKVPNTKIVGGGVAKQGAWPWMVLVGSQSRYGTKVFDCGGSLITSRHVLTAAHCFDASGWTVFVRVGEYDTSTETDGQHEDIYATRIDKHSQWTDTGLNDIAIVHLKHDVEFNDHIRPICLPINGLVPYQSFIESNPFVAGWGNVREGGKASVILKQVQLPVLENFICKLKYMKNGIYDVKRRFGESVLCVGNLEGFNDTCQGDSGGPLMLPLHQNGQFPFFQIGVVAYGLGCGRQDMPGAYTRVQYFEDWINLKLRR